MTELIDRAKEIRDETRLGRNTASRVGGLLVDIVDRLGDGGGSCTFTNLGGIPESEFDHIDKSGYYLYSIQAGSGEFKGILVVSNDGDIRQIRYEFNGIYIRSRTDEGWEKWDDGVINKLRKHIDNDTIYWDEVNQVIKAKGGGGDEIQIITIGINPNDVDRVTITAEGDDVIETTVTEAKDSYVIKVKKGGSAIVNIVAADGYVVSQVNVDKVSQGKIERFVFEEMQEDHTMYVWMAVDEEEQTDHDFLIRSDQPNVTYSGIGDCLASLQEDYPNGLTKDIMISCTMKSKEIRNSQYNSKFGIWVSSLSNWNQNSHYTLTINGNDLYTIDCKWLGGLEFSSVDNVIFKNLSIKNYYNQLGQSSPEEMAAIMFRKSNFGDACKNIILYNCKFDGYCVNSSGNRVYAWAGVRLKSTVNCIVRKCTFKDAGSVVLMMSGCSSVEITSNTIQGDYHTDMSSSLIAHPVIVTASGNNGIINMSDNDLNGVSMREYAVSLTGFKQIDIHRNIIHGGSGQFFSMSGSDKLSIVDNVIYGNITNGLYSYNRRIFGCGNLDGLLFKNNTVYMNGIFSTSQEVLSAGDVADVINCNNIVMDPLGRCYTLLNLSGVKGSYAAYNNLYASSFYNNMASNRWNHFKPLVCSNNNPDEGYLNMNFNEQNRLLSAFQAAGYETGSWALSDTAVILNIQNGGTDYKLIENLADTYQAYIPELPEFDFEYKRHNGDNATIGAYNLQGVEWDESADDSSGYDGVNTVDQATFTDAEVYQIPTDDIIVLRLNSKNRNTLLKTTLIPETGKRTVSFGQVTSLALSCVSREGMYVNDNLYDVEIERLSYE